MMSAKAFRGELEDAGLPAPWLVASHDPGLVLADNGQVAATVDQWAELTDDQACRIASLLVTAVNALADDDQVLAIVDRMVAADKVIGEDGDLNSQRTCDAETAFDKALGELLTTAKGEAAT